LWQVAKYFARSITTSSMKRVFRSQGESALVIGTVHKLNSAVCIFTRESSYLRVRVKVLARLSHLSFDLLNSRSLSYGGLKFKYSNLSALILNCCRPTLIAKVAVLLLSRIT